MPVTALPSICKVLNNIDLLDDVLNSGVSLTPVGVDYDGCGVMDYGRPGAAWYRVRYGPDAALVPYTDEIPF